MILRHGLSGKIRGVDASGAHAVQHRMDVQRHGLAAGEEQEAVREDRYDTKSVSDDGSFSPMESNPIMA